MKLSGALLLAAAAELVTAQIPPPDEPTGDAVPRSRPYYPSPWMDGQGDWAQAYSRAQALVRQMTLLEKVNITTGTGWQSYLCVGNVGSVPRLGLDELCMQDSPLGIRFTDYNSAFPAGGTIAASWDRDVWYRRGYDMGSEFRDKGIDVALGPAIGPLGRMPAGGRNWEGFSPDPYLTGVAVAQTVRGIQDAGVVATTKHFILNEQEHFRQVGESIGYGDNITDTLSSNIDDVTMHELYLWPFADAVRAGTGAIMCSYQQINNSYGCQNSYTLNHLLKNELGFQGFVMTDWQAHQSGVDAALAGVDMSMPGDTRFNTGDAFWGANLTIAVLNGSIPEWRIDDAATRIMAAWYYVGRDRPDNNPAINFNSWTLDTFGPANFYGDAGYGLVNQHVDVRGQHGNHIREYAAKSTILLKNTNGALPLTGREKFTAVFGEDAEDSLLGPNGCPDRGCNNGTLAMGWGSGTASFPYLVSPLEAIKHEVLSNGNGVVQSVTDNFRLDLVQAMSRQASHSLVFVNSQSGEGFINFDGNRGDRNNLTVWGEGNALIRNVSANCNNTIVVVHSVGPVEMGEWVDNDNITAIVFAGLPGEQSGNAIADVLYGRANPSGKLPFTMGRAREDWGIDVLYEPNNGEGAPQQTFREGNFIDYRHFDREGIEPVYPFGFGLSYTTFEYSNLVITPVAAGPYVPHQGNTAAAPTLGNDANNTDYSQYVFPADLTRVDTFIYPYINSTDLAASSGDVFYGTPDYLPDGARDGNPQPFLPASGAPGGNPGLWDVLYRVSATVTNTGSVGGEEIAQLYLALGGANDPVRVLRGFDKAYFSPGQTRSFTFDVTRRDLSNWDEGSQDWVDRGNGKTVWVGPSSRDLPLQAALPAPPADGGYPTGGSGGSSSTTLTVTSSSTVSVSVPVGTGGSMTAYPTEAAPYPTGEAAVGMMARGKMM